MGLLSSPIFILTGIKIMPYFKNIISVYANSNGYPLARITRKKNGETTVRYYKLKGKDCSLGRIYNLIMHSPGWDFHPMHDRVGWIAREVR